MAGRCLLGQPPYAAATGKDALNAARAVANSPLVRRRSRPGPQLGPHHDGPGQVAGPDRPGRSRSPGTTPGRRGMQKEGVRLERIREIMGLSEYQITIDLGLGRGEDRVWTCDLSEEYVRLNSKYTT